MKTRNFKYFLPLVCLLVLTQSVAMSQELIEPISKGNLISSIKLNRTEKNPLKKMNISGYIRLINRYGVNFPITAESEKEIRHAGEYFPAAELDKLILAILRNYRPDEPSEEEMKETVLRTAAEQGAKRGATRTGDSIEINNIIAGARTTFENFEKLGCAPPNYGPGYYCTFTFSVSFNYYSNEGTESANKHVAAWNTLLRWFIGSTSPTETVTKKFVWIKDRWILTD
jgi:hypothetical protein